ncbi:MAG: hypothetical protein GXO80_02105 [Chlorobi bacterium]|nr:hypothetical protein [Chlorobiota bacterium]
MGKVIKLYNNKDYSNQLKQVIQKLNKIEDELKSLAVNTATTGKWKEWSDNVQIGNYFVFTEEMLKNTSDKNVDQIVSLIDKLIKVKERIKINNNKYS